MDGVKKAFELEEHIRDIDKSFFEVKRNEHAEALTSHNKPSAQTNPDINEKVIEPSSITAAITSYKCSKCPKAYSLQSYLNQHIRLRHTSVPKFCCAVCPMKFIRRGPFLEHEKHHKENPNFKSKTKNTSDSTRPFQCMLKGCSKYFKDRKGFKVLRLIRRKFTVLHLRNLLAQFAGSFSNTKTVFSSTTVKSTRLT